MCVSGSFLLPNRCTKSDRHLEWSLETRPETLKRLSCPFMSRPHWRWMFMARPEWWITPRGGKSVYKDRNDLKEQHCGNEEGCWQNTQNNVKQGDDGGKKKKNDSHPQTYQQCMFSCRNVQTECKLHPQGAGLQCSTVNLIGRMQD